MDLGLLGPAALRLGAILAIVLVPAAVIAVSGDTFGYDFQAYHLAGRRVLDGGPLYDMRPELTGELGFFYYPPPFALVAIPFALLPLVPATWLWVAVLMAAFLGGVALMPVARTVKWAIVLLAGLSWPFVYALKLGQVGAILFLAFVVGWRWLRDDRALGASAAVGAAVKLQPGLVLAWALVRGRWRAVAWGVLALGVLALAATVLVGIAAWSDYLELTLRASDRITHPQSVSFGAMAFRAGASVELASAIQLVSFVAVVGVVLAGIRWATEEASYISLVAASQLLSPTLWDHYAVVLLVPATWLLNRGHWWGALLLLATPVFLVSLTPPVVYPIVFAVALVGPLVVGRRRTEGPATAAAAAPA
jgi:hypothetical protein